MAAVLGSASVAETESSNTTTVTATSSSNSSDGDGGASSSRIDRNNQVVCHFTGGEPCNPEYQADLVNTNKLEEAQLTELGAIVLELLRDPSGSSFQERLVAFAEANSIKMGGLKNISRSLVAFFRGAARNNLAPAQVAEDCLALGLTAEGASILQSAWEGEASHHAKAQVNKTIMANQLVDMEWKFGVTSATDLRDSMGSTFLHMKLVIDKGNGQREDVFMELSVPQFYEFMADMEKAKTHIDFLS